MLIDGKEWKLVPVDPTPEILAGAAIAAWPTASAADIEMARAAARIVLMSMSAMPGMTLEQIALGIATMAPAYRAMIGTAPTPPAATATAQEPLFWYRPIQGGEIYDGPISNGSIEDVRKRSGAWVPLYPGAAPVAAQPQGDDARDAARYRVLRMFVLTSGNWPFRGIDAPGGILAWHSRVGEPAAMTQDALDEAMDDMLGLIPSKNAGTRADYQEWRAAETKKRIDAAIAAKGK